MSENTLRPSIIITTIAILGALAGLISFLRITIPFPIVPFLMFDFAEIPDVLAFLVFGPIVGLGTTFIHFLILNIYETSWPIIGPLMKFFAVASMLLGFWIGSILSKKLKKRGLVFINMLVMGIVVRLVVMALLNLVLIFFLTGFFGFLESIPLLSGLSRSEIIIGYVALSSIYNVIHILISLIPAYIIGNALIKTVPQISKRKLWIYNLIDE